MIGHISLDIFICHLLQSVEIFGCFSQMANKKCPMIYDHFAGDLRVTVLGADWRHLQRGRSYAHSTITTSEVRLVTSGPGISTAKS